MKDSTDQADQEAPVRKSAWPGIAAELRGIVLVSPVPLLRAVAFGSWLILGRALRATAGGGGGVIGAIAAASLVAALTVWYIVTCGYGSAVSWAAGCAVVAWCTIACALGGRRALTDNDHEMPGEREEEPEAGPPSTPDPEAAAREIRRYVEHVVAAAHSHDRKGVHLADLLEGLHQHDYFPHWTTTELATYLRSINIPVQDVNIRTAGRQSNRAGVRHDALESALGHRPRLPSSMVPDLTPDQD